MEETGRSLAEYRNLTNRLNRYWHKLLEESLRIAKSEDLEIGIAESFPHFAHDITIYRNGQEVDASRLIAFAKETLPSLHRRYLGGMEKRDFLKAKLLSVLENHAMLS